MIVLGCFIHFHTTQQAWAEHKGLLGGKHPSPPPFISPSLEDKPLYLFLNLICFTFKFRYALDEVPWHSTLLIN